jgi:hypothetical protein
MTFNLTWLIIPIFLIGFIILIAFGVRSRLRYAQRIRDAQARGAFADMNLPIYKSRFRHLAILGLIGIFGLMLSMAFILLPWVDKNDTSLRMVAGAALVFAIICTVAGLLMRREIDRRL